MIYPVQSVANWFLGKEQMTQKKLQKLCYYAQAWSYALKNKPLMDSEFEAWVHGPVSAELYQSLKGSYWENVKPIEGYDLPKDPDDIYFLENVWFTYGKETGNSLEVLTHSEPPWILARNGLKPHDGSHNVITPDTMKEYYRSIYTGDEA